MYFFALVDEVRKVVEALKGRLGEFRLAVLYNPDFGANRNWNLIVSASWADKNGVAGATRIIAEELHKILDEGSRQAISRITVLKADDPFVQDMVHLYPVSGQRGGIPVPQIAAGGITEGGGFVFYSHASPVAAS